MTPLPSRGAQGLSNLSCQRRPEFSPQETPDLHTAAPCTQLDQRTVARWWRDAHPVAGKFGALQVASRFQLDHQAFTLQPNALKRCTNGESV